MPDSAKIATSHEATPSSSSPPKVRQADPLIGKVIDRRYRVEALLGEGGMGLVYQVEHTALRRTMAMKVLRAEATSDEEVLQRFLQEAQSASSVGNQHIVDISDFGVLDTGATYFVMEYLDGVDLIQSIEAVGHFSEKRTLHIAKQLCRALGAAHNIGIVHRDLKPENVLLVSRNEDPDFVKVLDFGIAKVGKRPTRLTRAGEIFGTPHYMSPEQCEGDPVDHRTDIYALGIMMYEMLTGHVPHDADTMMGILTKHIYHEPIPPSVRVSDISPGLERVVLRCLEKTPLDRYQSMKEVREDLERIEVGLAPAPSPERSVRATRPPRRMSPVRIASAFGVAAFAILAMLLVQVFRADSPEVATGDVSPTRALPSAGAEPAANEIEEGEPQSPSASPDASEPRDAPIQTGSGSDKQERESAAADTDNDEREGDPALSALQDEAADAKRPQSKAEKTNRRRTRSADRRKSRNRASKRNRRTPASNEPLIDPWN